MIRIQITQKNFIIDNTFIADDDTRNFTTALINSPLTKIKSPGLFKEELQDTKIKKNIIDTNTDAPELIKIMLVIIIITLILIVSTSIIELSISIDNVSSNKII